MTEMTPRWWNQVRGEPPDAPDLAEDFHEASKCYPATAARQVRVDRLDDDPLVARAAFTGARRLAHLPAVPLDPVDPAGERAADPGLYRVPSCRSFDTRPVAPRELSRLLWRTYGAYPRAAGEPFARRPVASGGALYPLELYIVSDVRGAGAPGVYHYDVPGHRLAEVRGQIDRAELEHLGHEVDLLTTAPVIVLIVGLFWRSRFKYGLRGYRFTLLEAGAVIHQFQLVAQSLGLGSVPVAGVYDHEVERLCGLDGTDESFLNAVLLGYPRG